jgi:hypothetical protein
MVGIDVLQNQIVIKPHRYLEEKKKKKKILYETSHNRA